MNRQTQSGAWTNGELSCTFVLLLSLQDRVWPSCASPEILKIAFDRSIIYHVVREVWGRAGRRVVHFYHTSIVVSLPSFRELSKSRANGSCETGCPEQADHRCTSRWLSRCARCDPFLSRLGFSPVNREDTHRLRLPLRRQISLRWDGRGRVTLREKLAMNQMSTDTERREKEGGSKKIIFGNLKLFFFCEPKKKDYGQ